MATEGQQAAQQSLTMLEQDFIQYSETEQFEIDSLRQALRRMVQKYGATASLAIIATGFEIAMREKH